MRNRVAQGLLFGVAAAVLGILAGTVPAILRFEENVGLSTLFQLRGPRPAPAEVVVVSLDKVSSDAFGLPNEPDKWPRTLHAELVDRLAAEGAMVIAFDVLFDDPGDTAGDARLGTALQSAGNVVLTGFLRKSAIGSTRDGKVTITAEQLVPPVPVVATGALAVAPFPLPVVPVKVSQFWTYKASAAGAPTFPTVIFQAWMLRQSGGWYEDLRKACPAIASELPITQSGVLATRQVERLARLARACLTGDRRAGLDTQQRWGLRLRTGTDLLPASLRSLFELYWGADTRYLNYYGPSRSIITVPYDKALRGESLGMFGKIVLVGFSEQFQPEQKDGFYSVFSDDSGLDLSGVEVAATAVANMLDGTAVRPLALSQQLLMVGLWGLLTGALCRFLAPLTSVAFCVLAVPMYLGWAWWVFATTNTWLPVMVPLVVQLPAALLVGILAQYRQTQRQRQIVLQAIGFYLPANAVDRLMQNMGDLKADAQLLHGTCLATDGEQYTQLAEMLTPDELGSLMNDYYEVLFGEVEQSGGVVTDVVGDAMMAIWATATPNSAMRSRACYGALSIAAAVARFNVQPGRRPLPTRVGLHSGPIRLGNIGSATRVEFRAVGDIVNTASRIEGLNKLLGTRILVSAETLVDVTGLVTRELGTFLLAGKSTPLVIHELLGVAGTIPAAVLGWNERFQSALATFRSGDWAGAGKLFGSLRAAAPDDRAVQFYVNLCERYLQEGPDTFKNGAVRIVNK
ncbi:MAG: adenylate/guanylate cyclase domain-containing protein [Gammaproteobacteria bacterium]